MKHAFQYNTAHLPPEFYGAARDDISLLAMDRRNGMVSASQFSTIGDFLKSGDLLVFNDSLMVKSSVSAVFTDAGRVGKLNFGTSSSQGLLLCEPRPRSAGETLVEGELAVTMPLPSGVRLVRRHSTFSRYWWAKLENYFEFTGILGKFGNYIRYGHVPFNLPDDAYTTPFANVPGSVEFPSASRPFTNRILRALEKRGVRFATVTLHCNLSSLEYSEFENARNLLDEEYFVSRRALNEIRRTHEEGGRVIAVGTAALRAMESCPVSSGRSVHGRTDIYIRPGFKFRMVDGLITGLHEPDGSHVDLVSALLDESTLLSAYSVATELGYNWHEFGDLSLIV